MESSAELESFLSGRLSELRSKKAAIREELDELDTKMKHHRKILSQSPKEKDEELVAELEKLERRHATTSQTTKAEREFMREKEKIRQKRKTLASNMKYQTEFDTFRARSTELKRDLGETDDLINELHNGLRKIRIATKAGCATDEILEKSFTFEQSKIARIVGRNGSNLRSIENECNVSIEADHQGGGVRIMGTPVGIATAHASIMTVVQTSIEEFPLPDKTIVCLMMDKAQRVNDIQTQFGVRLDISRAKNVCKITGLTEQVSLARDFISKLHCASTELILDANVLASLMKKGNSNVGALQDEFHVIINVNRDRNTLEIIGMRTDVDSAVQRVKEIAEYNKEVEELLKLEKHILLGCLIVPGSSGIRTISRDCGVRIDTEGGKEDVQHTIKIKGMAGRVLQAKDQIIQIIGNYISNSLTFEVAEEAIPAILGKGGAGIKAFREKYPSANIDINGCTIHINSNSAEEREMIKHDLETIVNDNFTQSIVFDEDTRRQFRGSQGAELRNKLQKELELRLIHEPNSTSIKIRGKREKVAEGLALLQLFQRERITVEVPCADEDFPLLAASKSGEDSFTKNMEKRFDIEVRSNRKDLCFTLHGLSRNVNDAAAYFRGFLSGDVECGSQIVALHRLIYSALIGKNGSNIVKMEADLQVKFDILKSRNQLRIQGNSAENLKKAKKAVLLFIHNCRVTHQISLRQKHSNSKEVSNVVTHATKLFQVEISTATSTGGDGHAVKEAAEGEVSYVLKGPFGLVLECEQFLREQLLGSYCFSIPLLSHHVAIVSTQCMGAISRIQEKYSVAISVVPKDPKESSSACGAQQQIEINGTTENVNHAKKEVMKMLEKHIPTETLRYQLGGDVPIDCLAESFAVEMQDLQVCAIVDRIQSSIFAVGLQQSIQQARDYIDKLIRSWADCHVVLPIEPFIVPNIVGKGGTVINGLRKETKASIEINSTGTAIEITGSDKDVVLRAKSIVQEKIRLLSAEVWEFSAPLEFMPFLIGKQGTTINKLRNDSGASIDTDGAMIRVHGKEESVREAKAAILEIFKDYEQKLGTTQNVYVPAFSIPAIIGPKGATIKRITETTSVKIEFDRNANKCTLKGSMDGVKTAISMIDDVLKEEGYGPVAYDKEPQQEVPVARTEGPADPEGGEHEQPSVGTTVKPKVIPGASPELLQKIQEKNLSKSSLRRLRRKQAKQEPSNALNGEDADPQGDDEDSAVAVDPTPTTSSAHLEPTIGGMATSIVVEKDSSISSSTVAPLQQTETSMMLLNKLGISVPDQVTEPVRSNTEKSTYSSSMVPSAPAPVNAMEAQRQPTYVQPSQEKQPEPSQIFHQQQLINLLLGESSLPQFPLINNQNNHTQAPQTGFSANYTHTSSLYNRPPPTTTDYVHTSYQQQYQLDSSPLFAPSPFTYNSVGSTGSHGPYFGSNGSLSQGSYSHSAVGSGLLHGHAYAPPVTAPPSVPSFGSSRGLSGLSIQTNRVEQYPGALGTQATTPPPPGLSPPNVSTSNGQPSPYRQFTFNDVSNYASNNSNLLGKSSAPYNNGFAQSAYQQHSFPNGAAAAGQSHDLMTGSLHGQDAYAQPNQHSNLYHATPSNSANSSATANNYYKSKNGFSVRL